MIFRLPHCADDAHLLARIESRICDNLLEQLCGHSTGARIGKQHPSWPKQFECEEIDIFVPSRCPLQMGGCRSELGGIEHNDIKMAIAVPKFTQSLKDIVNEWLPIIQ
jgi:hypothetical protein